MARRDEQDPAELSDRNRNSEGGLPEGGDDVRGVAEDDDLDDIDDDDLEDMEDDEEEGEGTF